MLTIDELRKQPEYSFLNKEPLGDNIILLGLGGSHAYGTNIEGSDLDLRGVATHSARDILTGGGFEQVTNDETDTTIYSLEKLISLLSNCNPNVIEILGLEPWQYIHISPIGQKLIDNRDIFLSKRAIHTFGSYAHSQLYRMKQLCAKSLDQSELEAHILNRIADASQTFRNNYFDNGGEINLYVDKAVNQELDTEIFMDINLRHYPLRDYKGMWNEMKEIVKSYNKIGKRNSHAIKKNKLGKHMMHLVRLYLMCFDILEKGEIITYRREEHDFLMDIRNGKYLDDNQQPTAEFYEIVNELEAHLEELKTTTLLPDNPDYKKIKDFLVEVNLEVITKWR